MDLKQINEALTQYIMPQCFPIALKLCQSDDELPEKVRMLSKQNLFSGFFRK